MSFSIANSQLVPVLETIFVVLSGGVTVSGIGYLSHSVTCALARWTPWVDQPDPTIYMRLFERCFETLFAPIGEWAATGVRSPQLGPLAFQLSIGIAVIAAALVSYIVAAGAVTGAVVVSAQTAGVTFEPLSAFRTVVALVVVCAYAVMFHAADRAKRVAV